MHALEIASAKSPHGPVFKLAATGRAIQKNIISGLVSTKLQSAAEGPVLAIEHKTEVDGRQRGIARTADEPGIVALQERAASREEQQVEQVSPHSSSHLENPPHQQGCLFTV